MKVFPVDKFIILKNSWTFNYYITSGNYSISLGMYYRPFDVAIRFYQRVSRIDIISGDTGVYDFDFNISTNHLGGYPYIRYPDVFKEFGEEQCYLK